MAAKSRSWIRTSSFNSERYPTCMCVSLWSPLCSVACYWLVSHGPHLEGRAYAPLFPRLLLTARGNHLCVVPPPALPGLRMSVSLSRRVTACRFSLLLLEPDEVYFDDYSVTYFPIVNGAVDEEKCACSQPEPAAPLVVSECSLVTVHWWW